MRIEILYPDLCSLFGDSGNVRYLKLCIPDAEYICTTLNDRPAFADGNADMIYMGAMTEKTRRKVIDHLRPYKEQLQNAIDSGRIILFTGNAMDVLFKYIETDDGSKVEGLGILDMYAKQRLMERYNTLVLAKFQDKELLGFKTQFTQTYGDNSKNYFAKVERGTGINKDSMLEGIHINNFFGTNLVGPILVMNPYFTEYIMSLLGIKEPKAAFRKQALESYNIRIEDFRTCKHNGH